MFYLNKDLMELREQAMLILEEKNFLAVETLESKDKGL